MEERLLNLNNPKLSPKKPGQVKVTICRGQRKMLQFTRDKTTKWKKKEDARNFLTDVQSTLTSDSQEAKELRMQYFPNKSLADNVARANLLMPAAVAVPAIGDAENFKSPDEEPDGDITSDLLLAAAHVRDAKSGRSDYGQASYYQKPRHAQIAFNIITNSWFRRLLYLVVVIHSSLTFIEPPSFAIDRVEYISAAIVINFFCLLLYLVDIVLHLDFLSWRVFWCKEDFFWNRVEFVFLCFFAVDWIILIVEVITGIESILQPFRALRLAMVLCRAKNLNHIYIVVQSIVFKLGGIVLIFLTFIVMFSCIGVHILMRPFEMIATVNITAFRPRQREVNLDFVVRSDQDFSAFSQGQLEDIAEICAASTTAAFNESSIYEGTFNHIGLASYQLFILLTTENYPVFMFPAFIVSQWYFFYFGTYILIGVFFLTAILLAIIANIYWEYNKKHVKKERAKQRSQLIKAWKILDPAGNERIPVDDPKLVALFHILKPKNSDEENKELISELDPDENGYVDWIQWITQLLTVLDYEKTTRWNLTTFGSCDNSCARAVMKASRKVVKRKACEVAVLLLIVLHSILFAAMWNGITPFTELLIQAFRSVIICIFLMEMAARFTAFGCAFFKIYNFIDLGLVLIAFVANFIWYFSLIKDVDANIALWRGFCVVISSLAVFFRLFFNSAKSRGVMTVFFRLFPIMWDLIVLFAIVLYLYAVIGMEAFSKLSLSDDTPSADYLQYNCGLGFQDFRCSLIIMFQLLTTSNWHDIMNSMILTVDSYAPLVYFFSFYMVVNLVIMNLLVAIGLEAFNKFSQEEKEKMEQEQRLKKEQKKKAKLTGRFLIKGVVDILSDTFASTEVWQQNEVHEENNSDLEADRRTLRSAPVRPPGALTRIKVRPKSSIARLGVSFTANRVESLASSVTIKNLGSMPPPARRRPSALPHFQVVTEAEITPTPDQVEDEGEDEASGRDLATATPKPKMRQDHLRKKLHERKSLTPSPIPSTKRSRSLSLSLDLGRQDNTENTLLKEWITTPVTVRPAHKKESPTPTGAGTPLQFAKRILRKSSNADPDSPIYEHSSSGNKKGRVTASGAVSKPKFRRVYHGDNWRSEVQDITILNKEELHELRRQLEASRSPSFSQPPTPKEPKAATPRKCSLNAVHDVYQSEPHLEVQASKPRLSPNRSHQFLFRGSPANMKKRLSKGSQDSLSSSDSDKASTPNAAKTRKSITNSPMVAVEEVPEPQEEAQPVSVVVEPSQAQATASPSQQQEEGGAGEEEGEEGEEEAPKVFPGWLVELTERYNVKIKTEEMNTDNGDGSFGDGGDGDDEDDGGESSSIDSNAN